jgi:hypothetical protein
MTVAHSALTTTELHENKGVSAASNSTVATASSGATVWQKIVVANIDATAVKNVNLHCLTLYMADICTAGSGYVVSPVAGSVTAIYSVVYAAPTTVDTILTGKIGGTSITNGAITVAFTGSAAGDVDSCSPSALKTVTAGQAIEISSNGAGSGVTPAMITIYLDVT